MSVFRQLELESLCAFLSTYSGQCETAEVHIRNALKLIENLDSPVRKALGCLRIAAARTCTGATITSFDHILDRVQDVLMEDLESPLWSELAVLRGEVALQQGRLDSADDWFRGAFSNASEAPPPLRLNARVKLAFVLLERG